MRWLAGRSPSVFSRRPSLGPSVWAYVFPSPTYVSCDVMQETVANHVGDISFALSLSLSLAFSTVVDCLWNPSQTRQHSKLSPGSKRCTTSTSPQNLLSFPDRILITNGMGIEGGGGRRMLWLEGFSIRTPYTTREMPSTTECWLVRFSRITRYIYYICCAPDCKGGLGGEGLNFSLSSRNKKRKIGGPRIGG